MALPTAGSGAEQDQFWPLPKFYFSVDIGDMTDLPFQEVSGLEVETEMIEYRHGNSPSHSKIKMPGLLKYSDITLKKGVFANSMPRSNGSTIFAGPDSQVGGTGNQVKAEAKVFLSN